MIKRLPVLLCVPGAGTADGDKGIDVYHILQSDRTARVEVSDSLGRDEDSHVVLNYKVANVIKISLEDRESEGDVCLTLQNDNGTLTELVLKGMYSVALDGERTLQHRYILYTRDGILIGWNDMLIQQFDGSWLLSPLILDNFHGKTTLTGTMGADQYVLYNTCSNRETMINNESHPDVQDSLQLSWSLSETDIKKRVKILYSVIKVRPYLIVFA